MAETWRIDTGRDVREVVVVPRGAYWTTTAGDRAALWPTPREAVQEHAYRNSVMGTVLAPGEPTRAELAAQLAAVTRERDVALGQIGPLLDAHDALVAAARAAGWTGAGATGAELVAWVRRGAMATAAGIAEDHGRTGVASAIRLAAIDLTGGE